MIPYYSDNSVNIYHGDALTVLRSFVDQSVQCVVTSPPYWGLRDYGVTGQLGLEKTPAEYVTRMVEVFREVRRVLRDDGTIWVNLGDSYYNCRGENNRRSDRDLSKRRTLTKDHHNIDARPNEMMIEGLKGKDLVGIPWRVAFALQADGWYLRSDIIWSKPNPMPESVTDRPTKAHEYVFLLAKRERYFFDQDAVREQANEQYASRYDYEFNVGAKEANGAGRPNGASNTPGIKSFNGTRNIRTVWEIATQPYPEAHFATFPEDLVKPCVLAGSRPGDVVLDPFAGSGTALYVAKELGRKAIGIELKAEYIELAARRLAQEVLDFSVDRAKEGPD